MRKIILIFLLFFSFQLKAQYQAIASEDSVSWKLVHEVWDMESGTIDLRFRKKFVETLKNPKGDAFVVFNLDRLTRNWYDENELEKYFLKNWNSFRLVSMHDEVNLKNASGRAMFRMKMVMNCFMPEDMKEKQAIGIARAKAEGKYKGRKKGSKNKNNGKM